MSKIVVQRESFVQNLIDPLSRFGLEYSPIQVSKENDDELIGMSHDPNCSVMGHVILKNSKGDPFDSLVIKDSLKLKSAFSFITDPTITLELNDRFLSYDGDEIKIKSYMLDKRAFDNNQSKKVKKILDMKFDSNFTISNQSLLKIKKSKEFSQSTKIYLNMDDKGVFVSRKDAEKVTSGDLTFKIEDSFVGEKIDNLPFSMSIFDLIQNKKDNILLSINKQFGILMFQQQTENHILTYITSALKK